MQTTKNNYTTTHWWRYIRKTLVLVIITCLLTDCKDDYPDTIVVGQDFRIIDLVTNKNLVGKDSTYRYHFDTIKVLTTDGKNAWLKKDIPYDFPKSDDCTFTILGNVADDFIENIDVDTTLYLYLNYADTDTLRYKLNAQEYLFSVNGKEIPYDSTGNVASIKK